MYIIHTKKKFILYPKEKVTMYIRIILHMA